MNCPGRREVRGTEATINTAEGAAHSAERTVGTAFPRTGRGHPCQTGILYECFSRLRTPLTLIADPINQLLADKSLGEHPHQLLELMKKNANILLRLVNQILDFRKVENGRMELHLEPFDLLVVSAAGMILSVWRC